MKLKFIFLSVGALWFSQSQAEVYKYDNCKYELLHNNVKQGESTLDEVREVQFDTNTKKLTLVISTDDLRPDTSAFKAIMNGFKYRFNLEGYKVTDTITESGSGTSVYQLNLSEASNYLLSEYDNLTIAGLMGVQKANKNSITLVTQVALLMEKDNNTTNRELAKKYTIVHEQLGNTYPDTIWHYNGSLEKMASYFGGGAVYYTCTRTKY